MSSREIEERVVEMRFDNEHFEKNVQTSMSTLDKFKQKLQFKEAGKGFDDIDKAAKKTDLSPLAKSADKVGLRFNAMYTMADQAFRNITNSAMAAGKRIVNALTIDPVKTGLQEYETKMNAVQVIQANTRGKNTMEDITAALEDLNTYADKTIYNFAQMTSNVGKFTAQGYKVEDAANAVKGLANLAAASGASAEDMARATYQMSQALGGTIRLMDWNSLRNANMATVDLKNTLIDLAKVNGIAIDDMIAKHGTFEQTLSEGWLSGDMFTEAMNIYSGIYSEAELKAKGFTDAQIENFMGLAKMAESAATEVKTFTQLFDVLKETAQSGWTQTWETIFGDFDTAKSMFTDLQVYFGDIINGFSEARNMLLGGALNLKNPWSKIQEKLEASSFGKVLQTFDKVKNTVEDASKTVEHFQKVVNGVWRGDYKNADTGRFELLEAAGYNSEVIQDLVNKGLGYKLTIEDIEESHKKFGVTIDGTAAAMSAADEAAGGLTVKYNELTDAQLEQAGLTKEEIKLFRALADEADRTGVTMMYLVNEMSENDGRTMLIESVKNAWEGLVSILLAVRDAWVDIFPPMTVVQLYNIIKGIREFSEHLIVHTETQEKLTRTLKGVFAILDIILTLVSLPMKIAFKALTSLLSVLDVDILSVTANIGDAVVAFRDWIDSALDFTKVWEKVIPLVKDAIKWFKNLGSGIQNGFSNAGDNVVLGLIKGLWNGVKAAGKVVVELGKTLIDKFCEILGIHSPSLVFYAIGGFIISGLLLGIKAYAPEIWKVLSAIGFKCVDVVKSTLDLLIDGIKGADLGSAFSAITSAATTIALLKISVAVKKFGSMFEGLGDMLSDVGVGVKKALKGLGSALKGVGASLRAKALKDIAIAILILAGALAVLSFIPVDRLIAATIAIGVLGIVLGGLLLILNKTASIKLDKETLSKFGAMILTLIGIAASMVVLAKSISILADIDFEENWISILGGIGAIVVMIGLIMAELVVATKFIKGIDFAKFAISIAAIAGLMLVMTIAMKIFSGLNVADFGKAITFITAFGVIVTSLAALSGKSANMKTAQIGSLVKNVGLAMLLMAVTCKIIAGMSWGEMVKAAAGLLAFSGVVLGLMLATKLATDRDVAKAGKVISSVGAAMLLMALTGKIINTMSWEEMGKAFVGIAGLSIIITGLLAATRLAGDKELKRIGTTLIMISVAIGVLAFVASLLSFMDTGALVKGVGAVTALGAIMAAMIFATSKAQNVVGNLIVMTVAIAIMTSAVASLSLIDTTKLAVATGAMVSVMGMFAVMSASLKHSYIDKNTMIYMGVMTLVVAALGGIVYGLSTIKNPDAAVKTTGVLITLMPVMTGLMIAISKTIKIVNWKDLALGMAGLLVMMGLFELFAWSLNAIPMDTLAGKTDSLIVLAGIMTVMTVLLLATAAVGAIYMATAGVAATGLAGLLAMLALFELFAMDMQKMDISAISDKEEDLNILTGIMVTMTALLVVLAIVGPLALIGVVALGGIMGFMTALGTLGVILTKLDLWDDLQEFVDVGIPVLEQLAHGLGSIVSNFVTGILSGLPEVGTMLSEFMKNAEGFVTGIKMVDAEVLKGVGILVAVFGALTATEFMSGITSFVKGLFGQDQFENFGNALTSLADKVTSFAESMGDFTEDDLNAVKFGAQALVEMAKAAKQIPNSGGLVGEIAGENDIDKFVDMLFWAMDDMIDIIYMARDIKLEKADVKQIGYIGDIIEEFAKVAEKIPNSGGWAEAIDGGNDIDKFLDMLFWAMDDMIDVIYMAREMSPEKSDVEHIGHIGDIIEEFVEVAEKIPNSGGILGGIVGNNDIDAFVQELSDVCVDLKALATEAAGLETPEIMKVLTLVNNAVDAVSGIDKKKVGNIDDLGANLVKFAKKMVSFCSKMEDINASAVGAAITRVSSVLTMCSDFTADKITNVSNFGQALADVANNGIEKFANSFSSDTTAKNVKTHISKFIASAVSYIRSKSVYTQFWNAGMYLTLGLRNGIISGTPLVVTAARNAARAAYEAAKAELEVNSPSKKFTEIGEYVDEGFAKGITDNKDVVENAMTDLTDELLEDTERELDINSPSLVYNEVGRMIVEGLAEGIDETDTAEVAMRKKLGNIYSAWYDWNKNNPNDQKTFAQAFAASGIRITQTMQDNAKALGYETTIAYLEDMAKQALADAYDGVEQDLDEAADNAEKIHRKTIEKLENSIESSKLKVKTKTSKLNILASDEEKIQTEIEELEYQNGQREEIIKELNSIIAEYSKRTNVTATEDTTDSNIIGWRKEINSIYEDIAAADVRIDELRENALEDGEEVVPIKIDPPSLDYSKKLGHHIVKNIAYGIEEDDSAEDAAKKKAQNINDAFQTAFDDISREQERRDLEYENWEINNPDAKQSTKDAKLLGHLKDELATLKTAEEYAHSEYLETKRILGETSKEAKTAYNDWLKAQNERASKEQEIKDTRKEQAERDQQEQKEYAERREAALDERREIDYALWLEENQNASEEVKRAKELEYLNEKRNDAQEAFNESKQEYLKLLKKNNDVYTPEVLEARNEARQKKTELAQIENDIVATQEEIVDAAEEQKDIAYRMAKLKYDIWEKTYGRDADDATKEAKQFEYLNEQASIQTHRLNNAVADYNKASSDFGAGSNEAMRAYETMLNEAYSLAELKSQILDLEESSADRQKRLKDKQDLAKTEYEEYIKQYEKFYLANGMTRADLERDAKLVSGYDPANIVNNITRKTKTALETATTSANYQNILTSFTDMGASYIAAINTGITEQSLDVTTAAVSMVQSCVIAIREKQTDWKKAGAYLVDGFAAGIKVTSRNAVSAAVTMAVNAYKAAKAALDVHSPSRKFAEIGKYAVLGLVKGLVDNTDLSDEAATRIGDSAIENLKSSIKRISEAVNSDIDTQPTIRPVLDLSNIRSGTARLNAMVSNAQAIAISTSRKNREQNEENQNGNDSSTKQGNTYQFTQNNYSPKALSRTEIYRQTKNQFTAMKEVLT